MNEDKIELMDYLNVLSKRKWFILIATLFSISAAAVINFLSSPKWEVDALIAPSKFFALTKEGLLQ